MHYFNSRRHLNPPRTLLRWAAILGFVVLGFSSLAVAQESDSDKAARVLELVRTANDAFEAGEFDKAYENYSQARDLFPNAAIYYRLGQTAERLNKPFEAVDHYEEFLALESTGETAQRVKARMPELRANLPARLELDSVPQGAEVHAATATGPERLGKTPLVVDRAVGELTIELTFPEHHPHRKTIELEAGTRIQTTIELQEIKPGEAEKVVTEARDRAPGIADAAREPSAVTGSDVVAAAPEPGERSDLSAWGWTATGLGVAVLATGGVFSYLQHSATEQANSYNKQKVNARPSELEGLKDDANSHYRTAMISYIAGGVITAGGIGLLVYSSMSDSSGELARDERRLKLGAGGDHQRAWLSVSGRF